MSINKKITNWIAYTVATVCLGIFIFFLISFFMDDYYYGFKNNRLLSYKYSVLFNDNFQNKIKADTTWVAKSGYIYFYNYESSQICIIELDLYRNIDINNIIIKNDTVSGVNNDFFKSEINVNDNKYPYPHILLYPISKKLDKINVYIKSNIKKVIKKEKALYVKFEKTPLKFNSIEKYAELIFKTISSPSVELLILKKQDRLLFILKYNTIRDVQDKTSLLDMVKMK